MEYFLTPSCSYDRVCSLPSRYSFVPFFTYCSTISANRLKKTTLCHSVRSCCSPVFLSFQLSLVAIEMLATALPFGIYRTSGSFPTFPTRITLLTPLLATMPSKFYIKSIRALVYTIEIKIRKKLEIDLQKCVRLRGKKNPHTVRLYSLCKNCG